MTRMMFWLCKVREILRNNHRSRHMSCHRRHNNQYPVSSKGPLECHEVGGAPWVLETFWYILSISWCNPLCPHQFLSSTYVVWHFLVPCLLRDGLHADGLDTPLEVPPVWLTSVLSGADHHLLIVRLKSQYLLAKRGTCLLWCGQPCCVSWYTVARMGSLWVLSFNFSIHGFVKGNVVYSHIQFDFLWGSRRAAAKGIGQLHFLPWSIFDGDIVSL